MAFKLRHMQITLELFVQNADNDCSDDDDASDEDIDDTMVWCIRLLSVCLSLCRIDASFNTCTTKLSFVTRTTKGGRAPSYLRHLSCDHMYDMSFFTVRQDLSNGKQKSS